LRVNRNLKPKPTLRLPVAALSFNARRGIADHPFDRLKARTRRLSGPATPTQVPHERGTHDLARRVEVAFPLKLGPELPHRSIVAGSRELICPFDGPYPVRHGDILAIWIGPGPPSSGKGQPGLTGRTFRARFARLR
jgi:hypothetical protein